MRIWRRPKAKRWDDEDAESNRTRIKELGRSQVRGEYTDDMPMVIR
jgi:hypothetical protein